MNFRKLNTTLHRDIGYLAVGLTLVYAISGMAVNHLADWNPNHKKTQKAIKIQPLDTTLSEQELTNSACKQLNLPEPRTSFLPDEDTLQLIYKGRTVGIDLPTGNAIIEELRPRPVLYAMNRLHLNAPKKLWTYIADLYALALIFLAISGMFIIKGKNGITGRGAWLTSIGAAIPVAYWIWWAAKL